MVGFTRALALALLASLVFVSQPARAVSTTLTLEPRDAGHYGRTVVLLAMLRYAGGPCPATPGLPVLNGPVSVNLDGSPHGTAQFYRAFYRECVEGNWTAGAEIFLDDLDIGPHVVQVLYNGEPGLDASVSGKLTFNVLPNHTGFAPNGAVISAGVAPVASYPGTIGCDHRSRSVSFTPAPVPLERTPPAVDTPYGFVNFRMPACHMDCGFLCPPIPATRLMQRMQVEFPQALPASATAWVYAPSAGNPNPEWQQVPATIEGRLLTVMLTGGWLVAPAGQPTDTELRGTLAVSFSSMAGVSGDYAGMWFGGAAENGWGLSVGQRGNRFSAALYVYDAAGRATWLTMPAQEPDSPGSFSGSLQAPNATWPGAAWIRFSSADRGTLEYVVNGVRGTKAIERVPAPAASARARGYAGDWNHAPYGGRMTINAVGDGLFIGWQTYTPAGDGTWLVMSAGQWTTPTRYEGTLVRTTSSPWLAPAYDSAALRVTTVGTLALRFDDENRGTVDFVVDGVRGSLPITRHGP